MKLFCKLPFSRISIDDDGNVWPACCPDWVQFPLGNIFKQDWSEIWYGEAATKLRNSMFDGSLQYCKRDWCPNVADAEAGIDNYHVIPLHKAPKSWTPQPPEHVNMNYDMSCNLKCPSCRSELIHYRGEQLQKVQQLQNYAEEKILPEVQSIALTGVGDPFISKVFRPFLFDFNSNKYPRIKTIHFHTNGLLFTPEMYGKMKGIHHLRISTDISIDAASEEVYNKVRPPGNWNTLMENLQFIKQLDNLVLLGISMVVQQDNYRQMPDFIKLAESLARGKRATFVEFKRIRHDPHLTAEQYQLMGIDEMDEQHKKEFVEILVEVEKKRLYNARKHIQPSIRHNLHEYLPQRMATGNRSVWEKLSSFFYRNGTTSVIHN
ncbi:MAG: SPASM domain-containing protein [Chitinophagales bacterium]|nr:SPASM domain-containing protein [Chitinophagales bacterium]